MPFRSFRPRYWRWSVLVLLLGTVLSAAAAWIQHRANERDVAAQLQAHAERLADLLQRRMQTYEYGLVGARGAVLAADRTAQRFSRENFQGFTSSFALHRRYPGSRGFGFVRRVPRTQEAAFVEAMRREYGPSFSIHEVQPALGTPAQG